MDDAAFHAFYERTGSRLRGYLRRLTGDFELADDILQEACPVTLGQDVSRVFERMRPRDRAVLWLTHVEGWSHAEVGQALGLKAISVRVLLFRARKTLARQIRRAGLQPEEDRREQTR